MNKEIKSQGLTYRDAGVDIDAGNALVERIKPSVKQTFRPEVLTGLGGFGGLFKLDTAKYPDPVLVSGTDGVGTKLKLAWQLGQHSTIGIDLVAMCVNDILTTGAEPLFFLDYFATGKLDTETAAQVIEGIAAGCKQAGCALIGGETAEMPSMYPEGEYDLAGFTVGVVNEGDQISNQSIQSGDKLIGIASSGPHSNGYSLIRKILSHSQADLFEACGQQTLGEALLAPTKIYVREMLSLIESVEVEGMAHITGGGILENIIRIIPEQLAIKIEANSWRWPPVFQWLQAAGQVETSEMYRTFNCGIGMVVVVKPDKLNPAMEHIQSSGLQAWEIGTVIAGDQLAERVSIL